jgi:hypothetical protein
MHQCLKATRYILSHIKKPTADNLVLCNGHQYEMGTSPAAQGISNIAFHGKDFFARYVNSEQVGVLASHVIVNPTSPDNENVVEVTKQTIAFMLSVVVLNLRSCDDLTIWIDEMWESIPVAQKKKRRKPDPVTVSQTSANEYLLNQEEMDKLLRAGFFCVETTFSVESDFEDLELASSDDE